MRAGTDDLREVCIDTNLVIDLFDADGDFSPLRFTKQLHAFGLHLIIPEMALAQALIGPTDARFSRFRNIVAAAQCAGPEYFSLGASLYAMRDEELACREYLGRPLSPRFPSDYVAGLFVELTSPESFGTWHQDFVCEARKSIGRDRWFALDQKARDFALAGDLAERGLRKDAPPRERAQWLDRALMENKLRPNHWILETQVPDELLRARIVADPTRFPFLVALALAADMNVLGAATDLRGHHAFGFLAIAADSWADARILAASVYSDVFATKDKNLRKRAELLARWGHFRPAIASWDEICPMR